MSKFLEYLDKIEGLPLSYFSSRANISRIKEAVKYVTGKITDVSRYYSTLKGDFFTQDANVIKTYELLLLLIEHLERFDQILNELRVKTVPMYMFSIRQYARAIASNYREFMYLHDMNMSRLRSRHIAVLIK